MDSSGFAVDDHDRPFHGRVAGRGDSYQLLSGQRVASARSPGLPMRQTTRMGYAAVSVAPPPPSPGRRSARGRDFVVTLR